MAYVHTADQDFYEELLGRGPGDPDMHGYPFAPNPTPNIDEDDETITDDPVPF